MNLTSRTFLSPISVALVLPTAFALLTGCKKDDPPPPPLPTATAAATQEPLKLQPVDAGIEPIDSGEPKKTGGGRGSGGGLKPCCAALRQNANLAPEPTKSYMLQAAATCEAAAAAGQSATAALGAISGMLRGAGMPAACK